MIYLDWAASAMPQQEACLLGMKKACEHFANPSAKHFLGEAARTVLETERSEIFSLLGITANADKRIIFTSGGTEANHIPLLAMMSIPVQGAVCISGIEHPAIREQAKVMQSCGRKMLTIPANKNGIITPEAVLKSVDAETAFVTVMAVNNETGAIQPIADIGTALEEYSRGKRKIHFHTDAVQAIGKIPFRLPELPIHSASFSGHKIGAPRGIGFLYLSKNIEPFLRGGGQENDLRAGTENLAGIISLTEALKNYSADEKETFSYAQKLMYYLIAALKHIDGIKIIPESRLLQPENYSPWILQFASAQLPGEVLVRCFSDRGICISTGSACSSKKHSRPVLEAMGVDPGLQKNAVRVSIGRTTTLSELEEFVSVLKEIITEF